MKKIITLIAAAAMLAVSCQKETPETYTAGNTDSQSVPGKLTATIAQTKVNYAEEGNTLLPAWEVGDEIIGFDDAGSTYTFTVASVTDGTATLYADKEINDGTYHLIYKSGASASDISSKTLAIDYTAQAGDKTMPAVMLSDGTVLNGICEFEFANAGAIIGISAVNGVPQDAKVTKITVEGENLSGATVALNGSALKLTATPKTGDAISIDGLDLTVTDANGTLSAPVFIAVPAGAKIAKVSASVTKEPETMTIPSTAAEKEGIDYVTIAGKKWAKWNVGANCETDYGWIFPWAGTEGYVWYADTWQLHDATSFEFSYTLSSVKATVASDYLYVKTQKFNTIGHSFVWENAPYHAVGGYEKYHSDDKTVLDLEDDAARANWSGPWRMPTGADFESLCNNTTSEWKTNYNGTGKNGYLFTSIVAGEEGNSIFLPQAYIGGGKQYHINFLYWSSSLYTENDDDIQACALISIFFLFNAGREDGLCVRPLSD